MEDALNSQVVCFAHIYILLILLTHIHIIMIYKYYYITKHINTLIIYFTYKYIFTQNKLDRIYCYSVKSTNAHFWGIFADGSPSLTTDSVFLLAGLGPAMSS